MPFGFTGNGKDSIEQPKWFLCVLKFKLFVLGSQHAQFTKATLPVFQKSKTIHLNVENQIAHVFIVKLCHKIGLGNFFKNHFSNMIH